ncbi:cytoskeletal protein CcmA (bactofilin family) [Dysgonomonas alginatilytica]|uniref:Cytoskeletal protein CcmA (Bactofilin family) n=1 Tax=Dysgonomonas alginatilytica TaxID=1605892 RepID=A0A2V3PJG5_9BACT|nr:polymer-forming cytoskeletal protein [Dysgonomonas alginatilytica]PXV59452.1 cytoskeletal protein CcmA (bactofilin family) [Dysgonomonas alginatilytica]
MWKKNRQQQKNNPTSGNHSCFSAGVIIEGDLHGNDNIRIDGTITGNINCSGKIVVGQTGIVTGDITCAEIEVAGSLTGNVQAEELLSLHAGSSYRGDALVNRIQIEQGASFFGTCTMAQSRSARIGDEPGHHLMNILIPNKKIIKEQTATI